VGIVIAVRRRKVFLVLASGVCSQREGSMEREFPRRNGRREGVCFCSVCLLALLTLGQVVATAGEALPKIRRIGLLSLTPDPAGPLPLREAFLRGLRDFGWAEGQNVVVEFRSAEGKSERLPDLAAELIGLNVEVIVVSGEQAIDAAKRATRTVPIVAISSDPVGTGLVPRLMRPGGNVTGLSSLGRDLTAKRLELLKEAVRGLSSVAVLWNGADRAQALQWREMTVAARMLRIQLHSLEVQEPEDLARAFSALSSTRTEALITFTDPLTMAHRTQIVEFARRQRLPTMFEERAFVEAGGLMAYGPSLPDLFRRAASYVDRILKGARPGELPVERPSKLELVINLETVRALRLTLTPALLVRVDDVIQ
jgi:putative ABC transport system substrate-binding protein